VLETQKLYMIIAGYKTLLKSPFYNLTNPTPPNANPPRPYQMYTSREYFSNSVDLGFLLCYKEVHEQGL
jgi:hypothetical protein